MRAHSFLLVSVLLLGLSSTINASCDLKNGDTATCPDVDDVKYIDGQKLTSLKATCRDKTLTRAPLKHLTKLKTLDLSNGHIQAIRPGAFQSLRKLRTLNLSDNAIETLELTSFDGLDGVRTVDLSRNSIRQLPPALATLQTLEVLHLFGNPLRCDCATLRVRDELVSNTVGIEESVVCAEPQYLRGTPLGKPEADVICMFETQDSEMMADEAGSGLAETELENEGSGGVDVAKSEHLDAEPRVLAEEHLLPVVATEPSNSSIRQNHDDDFEFVDKAGHGVDSGFEGSGTDEDPQTTTDNWDEGSGEGSGLAGSRIWFPDDLDHEEPGASSSLPTSVETTTTEMPTSSSLSWFDVFFNTISGEPVSSTPEPELDLSPTDEDFIEISESESPETVVTEEISKSEAPVLNRGLLPVVGTEGSDSTETVPVAGNGTNSGTPSEKVLQTPSGSNEELNNEVEGAPTTQDTKKGTGSYVVLAVLLGVLALLIGFAAYKGNFCAKRRRNEDPEEGRELKEMQKSLLEGRGAPQTKISPNGTTESAPLVQTPATTWTSPDETRPWKDSVMENGSKLSAPGTESEPVKPPRKSLLTQDDQNGVNGTKTTPALSTFAPRSSVPPTDSITPPNSPSSAYEDRNPSPPLSPNAQRVKITLQDNPDSIPKTPILITRTKAGENIVKRS